VNTELEQKIAEQERKIRDDIDNYIDTVYSILGFSSFWFFDSTTGNYLTNVKVFQGRLLSPIQKDENMSSIGNDVTPDLGVVVEDDHRGILGEVKKNFPKDNTERAWKVFEQLQSYDQELIGWPTENEKLESHSIALLVHQTTSRAAQNFYLKDFKNKGASFKRPFSIFQFNRSDQRIPYFFFQLLEGTLGEIEPQVDTYNGVQVPMAALVKLYSESKLYDGNPPKAYLLYLIWEHVFTPEARKNPAFERLRKDRKLEITIKLEEIVNILHEGFSFHRWHEKYPNRQRQVPRREWVAKACEFLVEKQEGKWEVEQVGTEIVVYYRKYDDVLGHFIRLQAESEAQQLAKPKLPGFDLT